MQRFTRAWFAAALLLLVGAALLHTALLLGATAVWPAMVHLTLFGWISAMIVAVNYHTLPVFTGRDFPRRGPIWAQLAALALGAPLAAAGMLARLPMLIAAGLALELAATLLFALNVALLLRGARRRPAPPAPPLAGQPAVDRVGRVATSAAGLGLPAALLLLLSARAGLLPGGWWLAGEHLAALGWVTLMIVGVAYHVLPRFSGRATRGPAWARTQLGLQLAALPAVALGLGLELPALFAAGATATALALALFAWTIWPAVRPLERHPSLLVPTVKGGAR
jgi:hypothetical protein